MRVREGMGLKGHWTIEIRKEGEPVKTIEVDNQLTAIYRGSILNQLMGDTAVDLDIKYLAVGDGDTPATAEDTQLGNERFRSVPTSKTLGDGYVQTIWVLTIAQANFHIREIGVFAGNATATANSGSMLSRIVIDVEKTQNIEVTFIRRDYVNI